MTSDRTIHMLLVGDDAGLEQDVRAALASLRGIRVVLQVAAGARRGVEEVRRRQPDLVAIPMDPDPRVLRSLAAEMSAASPNSALIGVYEQDTFDDDQAESSYLIQALRSEVRDFLRRPISSTELGGILERHAADRAPDEAAPSGLARRTGGRITSFVSNKGGVGKSTLSVQVAVALAKRHRGEVLLVDSSLQLGTATTLLDLAPGSDLSDVADSVDRLDATLFRELATRHSPTGLHVVSAPEDPIEASSIGDDVLSQILGVARRCFRHVIVDTFPVIDAVTLAVLDRSDEVYVVVGNDVGSVVGVERLLALLDRVGVARASQRIVLNATHPRHAAVLAPSDIATRLDRTVDHVVPFHKGVLVGANTGRPFVLQANRFFGFGRAMHGLVDAIDGRPVKTSAASRATTDDAADAEEPTEFEAEARTP